MTLSGAQHRRSLACATLIFIAIRLVLWWLAISAIGSMATMAVGALQGVVDGISTGILSDINTGLGIDGFGVRLQDVMGLLEGLGI